MGSGHISLILRSCSTVSTVSYITCCRILNPSPQSHCENSMPVWPVPQLSYQNRMLEIKAIDPGNPWVSIILAGLPTPSVRGVGEV